jgi:cytoskeletal protein RodZ
MSEAEKQEGQKTVVAFITGLLIGGLLVWVFSSSPEAQAPSESTTENAPAETSVNTGDTSTVVESSTTEKPVTNTPTPVGAGVLSAANQKAGKTVSALVTSYPAEAGWVVVRDYTNGTTGKVLGAARYNIEEGLFPSSIELIRPTVKGNEYQVSFYSENGDKKFATKDDTPVGGGEAVFKAE